MHIFLMVWLGVSASVVFASEAALNTCLAEQVLSAEPTISVAELRSFCELRVRDEMLSTPDADAAPTNTQDALPEVAAKGAMKVRETVEENNRNNRFVLTPHRKNYLLPLAYTKNPNVAPFAGVRDGLTELKNEEIQFQFSTKVLMWEEFLGSNAEIYGAYTNRSFWQAYNRDASAPFRETNHEPELIMSFDGSREIFGFRNVRNEIIVNHQSNGRSGELSRSWNRVMFNAVLERDNFVMSFKPWYRISDGDELSQGSSEGDDNPDIEDYMGDFEWTGAYKMDDHIVSLMLRNNFSDDNKGAVEVNWSFPLRPTLRGYISYFNGYGHSLIDYNVDQEVIGMGFVFTDLF